MGLTLNQPLTHKCVHCLHRPIIVYMEGLIPGAICLYTHSACIWVAWKELIATLTKVKKERLESQLFTEFGSGSGFVSISYDSMTITTMCRNY